MMMKIKNLFGVLALILIGCLVVSNVVAFGVITSYTRDRPLVMKKGEVRTVELEVANSDNEEITVEGRIESGGEIARLKDSKFDVPPKKQVKVPVEFRIPRENVSDRYEFIAYFRPVDVGKAGGPVGMGIESGAGFYVDIEGEAEKKAPVQLYVIIGLAVMAILIISYFLIKRKK